ncbi:hypothetical protein KIL84_015064 [Mauremys mutica]|uniref:Uncharacterized protein n=1 Tax=Mauremys mutica TaxID=74926 RepID=A0A9D3XS84_9SAUR|nr:hypothetical protein KIL84_015064 [Mauremys mutica]
MQSVLDLYVQKTCCPALSGMQQAPGLVQARGGRDHPQTTLHWGWDLNCVSHEPSFTRPRTCRWFYLWNSDTWWLGRLITEGNCLVNIPKAGSQPQSLFNMGGLRLNTNSLLLHLSA